MIARNMNDIMTSSPPSACLLNATGIDKVYRIGGRSIQVLRNVSLRIEAGQTMAITGPSGAGKTTLLHVLSGLDRPSAGRVEHRGQEVYSLSSARRTRWRAGDIGFIFQTYHLLPELTILENVMLPIMAVGGRMRDARARAVELLERVGLRQRIEHTPSELSGGEQQRAAIARALINNPELIFADEPTGNLDTVTGETILQCLFELAAPGDRTLIMVTHNPEIADRCDRRFHLVDGILSET